MPDREIDDAIKRAASDHHPSGAVYHFQPKPKPLIQNGHEALQRITAQGQIDNEADLREISPIRLSNNPAEEAVRFLDTLYSPGDLIFIGDRYHDGVIGRTIRSRDEWLRHLRAGNAPGPHLIINPLSGMPAPKKSGDGDSYRGDSNVKAFRYCLVEFDNLPREDQIRFWSAAKLPIKALIDSGGKSIHAWLDVSKLSNVTTAGDWNQAIKSGIYEKALIPLGVDRACCNPSRLSRLPGHFREEKAKFQRLLWLSPSGREVIR
jgi:hypothetical protein